MEDIPILPASADISYLNEGAANIVYRISIPESTPPPSILDEYGADTPPPTEVDFVEDDGVSPRDVFDNKLLRLRKYLPTTVPVEAAQANWHRLIEPLFSPDELVHQNLVQLRPGKIIQRLNKELENWEHKIPSGKFSRPTGRQGIYLADDEYGLLVTDMTPATTSDLVVEFKPKWLLQSPSAPPGCRRCRQCARSAKSNAERRRKNEQPLPSFCPLDLLSSSYDDILRATSTILPPSSSLATTQRFAKWLQVNKLLPHLRDAQAALGSQGIFAADPTDEKLLVAMALRDCTVFVRFPADPRDDEGEIEARLGDLDVKSKAKLSYWLETETELIVKGWYRAEERADERQENGCRLGRNP